MSKQPKVYLTAYPHLLAEWHPEKNGDLDPATITYGSGKRVWWLCQVCGREWSVSPNQRTSRGRDRGCPYCSGQRPIPGKTCLASQRPDLAKEWSPKNDRGPGDVSAGSTYRALWTCSGYGHEWVSAVYDRTSGHGCPVCAGRKVLRGFNDLTTTHPELAAEWSPKNGDLTPEMVSAGSHKKIEWVCGDVHSWVSTVYHRALHAKGCPKCCLQRTSKIEGELFRHLSEEFSDAEQGVRVGRWSVDVLIPSVSAAVEYDGAYFHKDSLEKDTRKTLDLLERGHRVVRVREQSKQYTLPPINTDDPHYLELTHAYSPDWSGLSDVVDQITSWVTSG